MIDTLTAWVVAAWTALTLFVAANIEPMPGVWVAAVSGSLLSAFTGTDKPLGRLILHIVSGVLVGVFSSQILAEIVTLKFPMARVAEAFCCSMFAEKIVASIHNGTIIDGVRKALAGMIGGRK